MTISPAKGLHKEKIKAEIRMRGWTMVALSRKWGFGPNAIAVCLSRPWSQVESKIATFLKMKPYEIWPDRYDEKGNPLKSKKVKTKNNKKKAGHNDQITEAA